jgi:hypothetical protein
LVETPSKAEYYIIDMNNIPPPDTLIDPKQFFESDAAFVGMRKGGLSSSAYYAQGFVFNAANGTCVDQIVFSFGDDVIRAVADDFLPANTKSFVDPNSKRVVQTQLQFDTVQLTSYTDASPVTYALSYTEAMAALGDSGDSNNHYWYIYVAIGSAILVVVVIGAVGAAYLVIRHRRRQQAMEGQVDEYDPDLGYAEL